MAQLGELLASAMKPARPRLNQFLLAVPALRCGQKDQPGAPAHGDRGAALALTRPPLH